MPEKEHKINAISVMLACLQSEICGKQLESEIAEQLSDKLLEEVFFISDKHDLAHLVASCLRKNGVLPKSDIGEKFFKSMNIAQYRYVQLSHMYEVICNAFAEAEIPYIPLKGSVYRSFYPEEWMRTSCDIDILIHENDIPKAVKILCEKYNFIAVKKGDHDVHLTSPENMTLELHYQLFSETYNWLGDTDKAWSFTVQNGAQHMMTNEMLYYYHIAHMAKHYAVGGCGVRPFVDLWLIDKCLDFDSQKRAELLNEKQLMDFSEAAMRLSRIWLENMPYDELTRQMENFILNGGVYGNVKNRVMVQQHKYGGNRFKYAVSRLWINYDDLKWLYPKLQSNKALFPFYQVKRWFHLVFGGKLKSGMNELRINQNIKKEQQEQMKDMLTKLGLKR